MNKNLYKIIFSRIRNAYVVVSEITSSLSGSSCTARRRPVSSSSFAVFFATGLSLSFMLMASAFAAPALPQGGAVAQGNVAVSQSGNVLTVNQSTDKAIVNWQSFSIGTGAAVNIVQPSASSTHLSRVTGNDPSVIQGQLNSNGQVVLVNPNGIVVGKDGSVSASSFTASTLNITDADFMAGKYQYARNGANGEVVNQGKIETKAGGYVALLGAKVTNEGTITSQQGAVYLGAGDAVAVPVTGSGRIKFEVSPAAINTSVSNNKDAVIVAEGGQVYMRAASLNDLAVATVQQSGLVDVSGAQGGNVTVLADKGQIKVDGTIKANSSVAPKGGNIVMGHDLATGVLAAKGDYSGAKLESEKGFVETSGEWIATTGTRVQAAEWLLDPANITISAGPASGSAYTPTYNAGADSVILATDIATSLNAGTSVTISTGTTTANGTSDGNIAITAAIVKSGSNNAKLTLIANNSITVGARVGKTAVDTTSTGKLDIEMTAYGLAPNPLNSRGIRLNNVLDANQGVVTLTGTSFNSSNTNVGEANSSNSGIVFNTNSGVYAASYTILGTANLPPPTNKVNLSGVSFVGTGVELRSTGFSRLTGWSSSQGNFAPGIYFADKSQTTIDAQNGSVLFAGQHANIGSNGVRIGKAGEVGADKLTLNTKGNVTISSQSSTGLLRGQMSYRNGNINVDSGTLSLTGEKVDFYDFTANLTANNGTTVNLFADKDITFSKVWSGGNFNTSGSAATFNITSTSGVIEINRSINAGLGTVNLDAPSIILRDTSTNETVATNKSINARFINITTNSLAVSALHRINTTINTAGSENTLTIKTLTPASGIRLNAADTVGWLGLSQAELNNFTTGSLILGETTNTGNIEVSSISATSASIGQLTLRTAGNILINSPLTIGASGDKNLTLQASGVESTVSQSGAIKAEGLSLIGSQAIYTLNNTGNEFSLLTGNVKSANIFSTKTLTVGMIDASEGLTASDTIKLESNGSIIVKKNITSAANGTSSSAIIDAIVLNAGKSESVNDMGTSTNDNVVMDGGVIGAGLLANARVKIYTGTLNSVPNNIIPAGNSRYGSDEVTTGYTKALDAGIYAIYRQRPTATVTFKNATKIYDGNPFTGINNGFTLAGLVNNDMTAGVTISSFTGDAEGKKDVQVGGYTISGTGLSNVGYNLTYVTGKLTINPKSLTASLAANNKTYDGNTSATGSFSSNDLVTGETLATNVSSLTFDNKNAGTNKLVTATGITLVDNGAFKASNYVLAANTATGSATIDKKTLTLDVSGASILDKTYNANTAASFNVQPSLVGVLIGESVGFSASANFIDPNAGNNKLVNLSNLALSGGDAINYNLTVPVTTLTGNINKARISVTINNATVNAGDTVPLTYTVNGLVNGQTATSAGISLVNLRADGYSASSSSNISGIYNILADRLNAQNYELSGADSITPGVLTVLASTVLTETTSTTDQTDATRRPIVSTTTLAASNAAAASAAVVIGGAVQGGEFSLASAEECVTSTCHCEKSDFDQDVELCYEEDPRPARGAASRISASL